MPRKVTNEVITAAIEGFEAQKSRINEQIADLRAMLSGGSAGNLAKPATIVRKRRKMSAAARKRIGDAQRERWAASRGRSESDTPEVRKQRKMSATGRRAISKATKKTAVKAPLAKAAAA